jgi:hypothetical protein
MKDRLRVGKFKQSASSTRITGELAVIFACATWMCCSLAQAQQPVNWAKARDAISEGNLAAQMAAAKPMLEQMGTMSQPLTQARPSQEDTLYSKSIILFDGETHTLVPIGSVLYLPQNLKSHVVSAPQGDFTFWPNFLKRNPTWLAAKEVPLQMAKGDPKLAAAVLREATGTTRLLVSVYRGCPISVLEAPSKQSAQR